KNVPEPKGLRLHDSLRLFLRKQNKNVPESKGFKAHHIPSSAPISAGDSGKEPQASFLYPAIRHTMRHGY
ncbi:hypothetical protein, partial [Cardiobacterium valvarum]|uniref:hypothetical protein n=1 Tax=Cardiobacterium valvarum TaxID=194702 RepID=UPI001C116004